MKKWLQISLSVFGIVLVVISFFVSEVEHYPSLLRCLCPKNHRATEGLEKLEALGVSQPFDNRYPGFYGLSDITMELLEELYTSTDFSPFVIEKFQCAAAASVDIAYGAASFTGKEFDIYLRQPLSIHTVAPSTYSIKARINHNQLRNRLEERLETRLLHWRFGVLLAGILFIQVPMFIVQLRDREENKS